MAPTIPTTGALLSSWARQSNKTGDKTASASANSLISMARIFRGHNAFYEVTQANIERIHKGFQTQADSVVSAIWALRTTISVKWNPFLIVVHANG
jgi:hypothetical protein